MKYFAFPAVLLLLISAAWAQTTAANSSRSADAPSQEQILALFKLMNIREQTATIMRGSENQTKATIHDLVQKRVPDITDAQLAELDGMVGQLYEHYPVEELLGDMVPVYQKHLTKADVDGISAFYSSPVGQKLLRETPAMSEEAMQIAMARIQSDTEDILVELDRRIQQMAQENENNENTENKDKQPAPAKGTVRKPSQPQK